MIALRLLPLAAPLLLGTPVTMPPTLVGEGAVPSLNPLASLDKATLKGFVEQPLFEPSRHPPAVVPPIVYVAPPPPPPPPMIEPPPSLRLLGLVEGAHSVAAVVRRNDSGKTETLRPGDRIGTWVIQVMPAALRLSSGDRAFDYALFRGGAQQGPVPVPPPPPFEAPTVAARDPITGTSR